MYNKNIKITENMIINVKGKEKKEYIKSTLNYKTG